MKKFLRLYLKELKSLWMPAINLLIFIILVIIYNVSIYHYSQVTGAKVLFINNFGFLLSLSFIAVFFLVYSFYNELKQKNEHYINNLPVSKWTIVLSKVSALITVGAVVLWPYCLNGTEFWVSDTPRNIIWARFIYADNMINLINLSWFILIFIIINGKIVRFGNYRILILISFVILYLFLGNIIYLFKEFLLFKNFSNSLLFINNLVHYMSFIINVLILIIVLFLYEKYEEV
jgi:hypothetical protein